MALLGSRIAELARAAAYRAYRATKPAGWVHELTPEQLEHEVDRWYWSVLGEHVDFSHPRSFSEKLQWLKVHDNDPRKTLLSDKLAVRPVIAETVGEEVLPKVYQSWDAAEELDFAGLSQPFFLKCNNGSGMMACIADPAAANMADLRKRVASWLKRDFAAQYFEMHYAGITPRVYAEEWLDDIAWEYQAWCFSGKVEFISAIREPHGVNEKQTFSPVWEQLPFITSQPEYPGTIERPACLEQLIEYSEVLAGDLCFVRVDWYGTRHGLMFSEMSFTPAYGIVHWVPKEYNLRVGSLIHLPIEG